MKELVLSIVISSLTIIAGYVVIKKTDIDILEYFKTKKSSSEKLTKIKSDEKDDSSKSEETLKGSQLKEKSKRIKALSKKIENNKKSQKNELKRELASVLPGKKVLPKKNKLKKISDKKSEKKINEENQKEEVQLKVKKKAKEETATSSVAQSKEKNEKTDLSEESGSSTSTKNALKRKKVKFNNLEPILTKVNDLSVSETDLDDIIIDINDEKTKSDFDRNGDEIDYTCSFTSENREEGMLERGSCEEIGDVNFSFDNEKGKLIWILNEPGSMISGIYNFSVVGSDGPNKDTINFKITIEDGNSNEPENNTNSVKESSVAGGTNFNNPPSESK